MRKILYSILAASLCMVGCTNFDDPSSENYGSGPSVSIDVTEVTDETFTFTVTPASGTNFYSYVVVEANAAEELNGESLLKGNYKGLSSAVLSVEKNATYTFDMRSKGEPMCSPYTTYQIYAVAGSDKGIAGAVANVSVTTTDGENPAAQTIKRDEAAKSAAVTFSEAVIRGEGAVTAKYYKEWDISNTVALAEDEFTVVISGSTVTFAAPKVPAGAYIAFSWAEGAFVDSFGNKCAAVNSGLNPSTGSFTGAYVHAAQEPFAVADSCFTAPAIGGVFPKWEEFEGEITFEFNVYRNDNTVKPGAVSVVYSNDSRTSTLKLTKDQWSISGKQILFSLPSAPAPGDIVSVVVAEAAIADVYGNPNKAYSSEEVWWKYFAMTKDMVLGNFAFTFADADGVYDGGTVTITEDPEKENGLIIENLYMEGSIVPGSYDISTGKFYISSGYELGTVQHATLGVLTLTPYSLAQKALVEFTVNADGSITSTDFGVFAFGEDGSGLGWWEMASLATFTPVVAALSVKTTGKADVQKAAKAIDVGKLSIIHK